VRDNVPPRQLLKFQPSIGWAPPCEFLGKLPPVVKELPRLNKRAYIGGIKKSASVLGTITWIILLLVVQVGVMVAQRSMRVILVDYRGCHDTG
jgi:Sulfotransferase domain